MVAKTQSTSTPTYARIKEWLTLVSIIVVVTGGIAAGLLGGMKLVIAPLQTDIRAIHARLDGTDSHIQGINGRIQELHHSMQNEFKAVRKDIAIFSERLTRLETLLEHVFPQPDIPQ